MTSALQGPGVHRLLEQRPPGSRVPETLPTVIGVRGARRNNLRDIDGEEIVCPVCGARFDHPSAESFAFNSYGACPACDGLGVRSEVDVTTLVPDPGKTIEEGAVLPWNSGGRRLSMYAAGQLGVR